MVRIQRLDVRGFRGVRQERSLLFQGNSVLLFGENGTGKSTFVDALEKLFAGRVSTLDNRALGVSSDRHGPHILDGGYPTRVQVTFTDGANTVFSSEGQGQDLPALVDEYLQSARQNLYILRRRQVLEFIDSPPKDRYALLRPFLPLSGVEDMENALRAAKERAEADVGQARSDLVRLVIQIRRDLGLPASNDPPSNEEIAGGLTFALQRVGQPGIASRADCDQALQRIDQALAPFGDLSRQSNIAHAVRLLDDVRQAVVTGPTDQLAAAVDALRAKEAEEARVFYENVLEQGARWIEEEKRNTCPLCEQGIVPDRTITRARERLNAMRQLLNLRRQAKSALDQTQQAFRSAIEPLQRAIKAIASLPPDDRAGSVDILEQCKGALQEGITAIDGEPRDIAPDAIDRARQALRKERAHRQRITSEEARLRDLVASLPSPDTARALLSVRDVLRRAKDAWKEIEAAQNRMSEAVQQAAVAGRVHEAAKAARREEVQRIFDELSQDINRLYVHLHPDENHGGVRLEVREVGQGSANLKASFFHRQDEDPRGYYSDAHLDTLGLSIFLALRRWDRMQRPGFDLLVLDDVLTSVDVHHSVRLSELLLREFKDYQILLTTHDRIWFEHLRDIQARCRVANSFVNKIIHKWSIEDGPDIREPQDERAEIDRLMADGSSQEIAATSGRLLEHLLQEMRYSLRLSVQAKRGEQYEIGDLWPVFYVAMREDYATFLVAGRKTIEALDVRWPLRNWIGAHWNVWALNVPRSNATEFAAAVRELFDLLFCSSCRRFVAPSATPLGQLACRCGDKLYPALGKDAVRPRTRADLVDQTRGVLRDARLDTGLYLAWKRAETGRER